jgi:NitT/TauT family transport system substrate-binding protein
MTSRYRFRSLGSALFALFSLAVGIALAAVPARAEPARIRIGVIGVNESQLPLLLAIDQGFFAAEGIEVELTRFAGGGIAAQAFVGGSIDLCACASDHVVRLYDRGTDARILVGIDRWLTSALIVRADSPYGDLVSLRGQAIGVSAPGSFTDNTIRWAIGNANLNADRDFSIIGVGAGTTARAALESGKIAAALAGTTEIIDYDITAPGSVKIIQDWRKTEHAGQLVFGRQSWVDANPELARKVVHVVIRALQLIRSDHATTVHGVKLLFPDKSDAYAEKVATAIAERYSPDGSVSPAGFNKMVEIMSTVDPELKPIPQSAVDLQPQLSK